MLTELPFEILSRFELGPLTALYLKDGDKVALALIPAGTEGEIPAHRKLLNDTTACRGFAERNKATVKASSLESMAQAYLRGDARPASGLAGGTLRNGGTANAFKFVKQESDGSTIKTFFENERGVGIEHSLKYEAGRAYVELGSALVNGSKEDVDLDFLESFSLGMLSPFQPDDGPDKYVLHRFRSSWSAEGRHVAESIEDLGLEEPWAPFSGRTLRFGQRSSQIVKEFFPAIGFEDKAAGVTWAAQLAVYSAWQMQVTRIADQIVVSGGLPDFEFGGWRRRVKAGERFAGPTAIATCVKGDIQDAFSNLNSWPLDNAEGASPAEAELPVIFNEYCATWCNPSAKELQPMADALAGSGVRYFVIDAGWFKSAGSDALNSIGDWDISKDMYPDGFKNFIDGVRAKGFIPGIWFEFENLAKNSKLFEEHKDWLLKLDGAPYQVCGDRYFLDFRKKEVWEYLDGKLIAMLRENGIGYLKIDYNASFLYADCENGSPAEGAREVLEAVRDYYKHIRAELPELTIEVCASGGYRLTPEWMRLGDMASFSDAHECECIPIVAANVQTLIPLRRSQVWATLRPGDTKRRERYSLAAAFIGRLCVSGEVAKLSAAQRKTMREAIEFYKKIAPLIKDGKSRVERNFASKSYNHPAGHQIFRRKGPQGELIVIHGFAKAPEKLSIAIEKGRKIAAVFDGDGTKVGITRGRLTVSGFGDFNAVAILLA